MKKYMALAAVILAAFACQQHDIDTYDHGRYIRFSTLDTTEKKSFVDSAFTSFTYFPDNKELVLKFEVNLIGQLADKDLAYHVAVINELTTAPQKNYAIESSQTFRSGRLTDSMTLKLIKTPDLKEEVCVVVALEPGGDFDGVMPGQRIIKIKFNNKVSQPLWWDKTVTRTYLGTYSDEKFTEFIRYTGVSDFGALSPTMKRYHALEFKGAIIKHGLTEKDGSPMTVPIY